MMIWFSDSRAGASPVKAQILFQGEIAITLQVNNGKLFPYTLYKKAHHVDWNFSSFSKY